MKKSDIKNGMHVITNMGCEYVVISDIYAPNQDEPCHVTLLNLRTKTGWMTLDDYDDDLHCIDNDDDEGDFTDEFDIAEVYAPSVYGSVLRSVRDNKALFVKLWERHVVKKMTKADIEKELGYEIEIVDEDRNGFDF